MLNKNQVKDNSFIMLQISGGHYMLDVLKAPINGVVNLYDEGFSITYVYRDSKEKRLEFSVEVGMCG